MLKPLNAVRSLKDPLKQFTMTWSFTPPAGTKIDAKSIELRCQSFSMPTLTGDTTEVTWGGFKRVYAGKQTRQGSWRVTFVEVWNAEVLDGFKNWCNVYHQYKAGKITLLNDYATNVNVVLCNPNIYDATSEAASANEYSLRLYDVFPTNVSIGDVDASSANPTEITCDFNYNYFLLGDEIAESAN